jgi:hypothetical protein
MKFLLTYSAAPTTKTFDSCQLQIRLANGQRLNASFSSQDNIAKVVEYVVNNRGDGKRNFTLSVAYPKKDLTDLQQTLEAAGLVPRCALIVTDK